jgi:hypothetical protein
MVKPDHERCNLLRPEVRCVPRGIGGLRSRVFGWIWQPRFRWLSLRGAVFHIHKKVDPMTDTPPDRLSTNPKSPHYDAALLERGVGVRFKGVEKSNVDEYCVSEGWVRLSVGTAKDRAGNFMTVKLKGTVEPYFRTNG